MHLQLTLPAWVWKKMDQAAKVKTFFQINAINFMPVAQGNYFVS